MPEIPESTFPLCNTPVTGQIRFLPCLENISPLKYQPVLQSGVDSVVSVTVSAVLLKPCHLLLLDFLGLQTTRLGNHLEDRVNKFLRRQNHPEAGEVFVRVVASSDKTVEVKPGMKSRSVCLLSTVLCEQSPLPLARAYSLQSSSV